MTFKPVYAMLYYSVFYRFLYREKEKMPRKKKSAASVPKLSLRGKKYYFRRWLNGKDKWISTGTSDQEKAKQFASSYIDAETYSVLESKKQKKAHKIAEDIVEIITGQEQVLTPVDKAHEIWVEHFPKYNDLSEGSRKNYHHIFDEFADWCNAQNVQYIEQVDRSMAIRYSKHLWDTGISGRTYNGYLKHLSRVFSSLDNLINLTHRNPFSYQNIPRVKKNELATEGKQPLEPDMLSKVVEESAKFGDDYRDLIIIGSQTGIRLKDAALLKWDSIKGGFIEIMPFKTKKSGGTARMPVSPVLAKLLEARSGNSKNEYVIPFIADQYIKNYHEVVKQCKKIFENALGKDSTVVSSENNPHRKRDACVYSFHSFRTTFMSLLAAKDVSSRDAMRMLGWESPEMIQVYEKMLEKARGDSDKRAFELVSNIEELKFDIPESTKKEALRPTKTNLEALIETYSNCTIGKIYGISETAVRKWLRKYGIVRGKRVISDISEEDIQKIRNELKS